MLVPRTRDRREPNIPPRLVLDAIALLCRLESWLAGLCGLLWLPVLWKTFKETPYFLLTARWTCSCCCCVLPVLLDGNRLATAVGFTPRRVCSSTARAPTRRSCSRQHARRTHRGLSCLEILRRHPAWMLAKTKNKLLPLPAACRSRRQPACVLGAVVAARTPLFPVQQCRRRATGTEGR